jgi:hypothetical protein
MPTVAGQWNVQMAKWLNDFIVTDRQKLLNCHEHYHILPFPVKPRALIEIYEERKK